MSRALLWWGLLWICGCEKPKPPSAPPNVRADESAPIATVDGVAIPPARFNLIVRSRLRSLRGAALPDRAVAEVKLAVARELIDDQIVDIAAQRRGVTVEEKQIDAALADLAATFPSRAAFDDHVANYPQQAAGLRSQTRSRLLRDALVGFRASGAISDQDARAYYEQHTTLFHTPTRIHAQEIVIALPPGSKSEEIVARRAKAADAAAKARSSKNSFTDLARSLSEAPSATTGGELGIVTKESIEPPLWAALQALRAGQSSGIIQTTSGLHVLHLVERIPAKDVSLTDARPGIEKVIRIQRRSAPVGELMRSLREHSHVDSLLAHRLAPMLAPLPPPRDPPSPTGGYPGARAARAPTNTGRGAAPSGGPTRE